MLFCELFPPYSQNLPWPPSSPPPPLPFCSNQIPNNAPFLRPYPQQHSSKTSPFNRRAPVSYHKEVCKSEYGPGRFSLKQRDSPRTPFRSIQPTAFNSSTNGQSRKLCDVRADKSFIRNMNPSEHTSNADGRGHPSTSLQPYANNGYQRREPYSGPSSPVEQRRDFGMLRHNGQQPTQPHVPQHAQIHASSSFTLGPAPGAKLLVDPATGQQYYVPAQPQMAYYPVFYNAPPHQPQPLFYQPTMAAPSGFFVGPPPPASPTHGAAPVFFQNHPDSGFQQTHHMTSSPPRQTPPQAMPNQGLNSSNNFGTSPNHQQQQPYRVEIPPSTACGSCVSPSPYFKRHHQSRVSMESAASSTSNSSRNKHSDDSMSPMARARAPVPLQPNSPASRRRQCPPQEQQQQSPYTDAYNSSARYSSTTSSSSTSGFASIGVGESSAERPRIGANQSTDSVKKSVPTTKAPAYPPWWGDDNASPRDTKNTTIANIASPRHAFKPLTSQDSFEDNSKNSPKGISTDDSNSRPTENAGTSTQQQIQRPIPQKAIRMDIDFKRPTSPEQAEQKVCVKANVNRAAPPTCFMVSFDDDKEQDGDLKKPAGPFSLQDAARQAPTGRRLMRRSAPTNRASNVNSSPLGLRSDVSGNSGSDSGGQDPKHYLFKKMIQGYDSKTRKSPGDDNMSNISQLSASSAEEKRESDVLSEAGTYIVDEKNRRGTCMLASQIIDSEDEDDTASSTATTISESTTGNSARASNSQEQKRAQISFMQKIAQVPETNPTRRSLMSDLRKLREENANRVSAPNQSSPRTTTTQSSSAVTNSGLHRTSRVSSAQTNSAIGQSRPPPRPCQQLNRPATTTNAFRSAGQRCHSETRGDGGRFSMRSVNQKETMKPPFRTGLGGSVKSTQKQNVPNESPEMVAWLRRKEYDPRKAAAEARKMQQLKQRDIFINNRSVSYHNPGGMGFKGWQKQMGDDRSNKSHDDLSRVGEECEDLSQFSIPGSSNSSLKRTIDELTEKCHKSIALIRLTNKDSLSESVENLLERVVDPDNVEEQSEPSEHISNRLERLSEAFDAIQKYLEEQSTSDSPSMNRKILSNLRPRASSGSSLSVHDSSSSMFLSPARTEPK
ncbi:hypothetical protein DdX_04900 [Ditylenchus destructor]|uniref:Uncharacterized protein n=1 Tax=Ditylenchus destructor TaxID=166010 RepID=A0AAD4RAJ3_9BILA|nr:hypothetical protein DdX_04900 [Ditylenchus destructor]